MFGFFKKKNTAKKESNYANSNDIIEIVNAIKQQSGHVFSAVDIKDAATFKQLKQLTAEEKKALILRWIDHFSEIKIIWEKKKNNYTSDDYEYYAARTVNATLNGLLKSKLNYTEDEWLELFAAFEKTNQKLSKFAHFRLAQLPITYAIKQIEYHAKKHQLSDKVVNYIKEVLKWPDFVKPKSDHYWGSDMKKAKSKLEALAGLEENTKEFVYKPNDIGDEVNKIIQAIDKNEIEYVKLFKLVSNVSGGKPTAKLSKQLDQLIDTIGSDHYRKTTQQILEVAANRSHTDSYKEDPKSWQVDYYLCNPSQTFIKGLAWTCTRFSDKTTIQLLSKIVEKSYLKIPGKGPAAAALGNAGVYALGNMRGKEGLGALSRLKLKVRQNNVKKTIDKYLTEGAKKYNVSVEELKEMAVPSFSLTKGAKEFKFGDYTLNVFIDNSKVTQQWIKPDGATMKSVPSIVKNNESFKKKLSAIRKEVKEIQKVYSAQKQRIDNQFILDREWDYPSFEKTLFESWCSQSHCHEIDLGPKQ